MWNRKVFIRIIEALLCVACVVALRVTDDESRRVFHYLRNRSREWSLLNNVTWGSIGAALATVTCGGYIIITTGLLIAAATEELRGRKTEFFLLGLGVILFGIVGALALASIDSVPEDLVDNAAVLGALCLLTALVFIGDLLMSPPKKKDKQAEARILEKDLGKRQVTPVVTVEDTKSKPKPSIVVKLPEENGRVNDAFQKADDHRSDPMRSEQEEEVRSRDSSRDDRRVRGDQEPREYTQNFENGRVLRDSQRYRDMDIPRVSSAYDPDRRIDDSRIMYKSRDIYQRPIDEIDTPRFPAEFENRNPMFAKIVNPSVKIMQVERDVEEALNSYRYSDNSQYDNVPVRMRSPSSGILKGHRDVSFNAPPPPKGYRSRERSKDEIEMLEEYLGALRTTGTQTAPSSPTDPGYVRHTASNWPQDTAKSGTQRPSPDHTKV